MAQSPGNGRKYRSEDGSHVLTYGTLCQMSADVTSGVAPAGWSFEWADDRQSVDVRWELDGEEIHTYKIMPTGW